MTTAHSLPAFEIQILRFIRQMFTQGYKSKELNEKRLIENLIKEQKVYPQNTFTVWQLCSHNMGSYNLI